MTTVFPMVPARLEVANNNFDVPGRALIALTGMSIRRTPVETGWTFHVLEGHGWKLVSGAITISPFTAIAMVLLPARTAAVTLTALWPEKPQLQGGPVINGTDTIGRRVPKS